MVDEILYGTGGSIIYADIVGSDEMIYSSPQFVQLLLHTDYELRNVTSGQSEANWDTSFAAMKADTWTTSGTLLNRCESSANVNSDNYTRLARYDCSAYNGRTLIAVDPSITLSENNGDGVTIGLISQAAAVPTSTWAWTTGGEEVKYDIGVTVPGTTKYLTTPLVLDDYLFVIMYFQTWSYAFALTPNFQVVTRSRFINMYLAIEV